MLKKSVHLSVLSLWVTLLLAACQQPPVAQNINKAIEDWKNPSHSAAEALIEEFPSPAFASALGFDVIAYPNTNELTPYKFFALEGWFGQIQYKTPDDRVLVVRIAIAGTKNLVKTYSESHLLNVETITIDGVQVETRHSSKGCMIVVWEKNGFQYLVHSRASQIEIPKTEIEALVKGLDSAGLENDFSTGT